MYACMLSCSVVSNSFQPYGLQHAKLLCPWDCPGKNTGVGCHALLQGILPTQGLNPGLRHCRQILYQLSYQRWGDSINICGMNDVANLSLLAISLLLCALIWWGAQCWVSAAGGGGL